VSNIETDDTVVGEGDAIVEEGVGLIVAIVVVVLTVLWFFSLGRGDSLITITGCNGSATVVVTVVVEVTVTIFSSLPGVAIFSSGIDVTEILGVEGRRRTFLAGVLSLIIIPVAFLSFSLSFLNAFFNEKRVPFFFLSSSFGLLVAEFDLVSFMCAEEKTADFLFIISSPFEVRQKKQKQAW
jgi:hypothetical protein